MSSKENDEEVLARSKKQVALAKTYKRVFESKDGKTILADLSIISGFSNDPFVPGQADATAYLLGMHRLVKRITGFLSMSDVQHLKIVKNYEVEINE